MICLSHDIRSFGRNSDLQQCYTSLRHTETRRWHCAKNGFQALRLVLYAGYRGRLLPAVAEHSSLCYPLEIEQKPSVSHNKSTRLSYCLRQQTTGVSVTKMSNVLHCMEMQVPRGITRIQMKYRCQKATLVSKKTAYPDAGTLAAYTPAL
jgi:hypothetical protein